MELAIIPNWILNKWMPSGHRQYSLNVLLSTLLSTGILFGLQGSFLELLSNIPHFCLIDQITGTACPMCGTTRGVISSLQGKWDVAFQFNLVAPLMLVFFLIQVVLRSIDLIHELRWLNTFTRTASWALIILAITSWLLQLIFNPIN